MVSCLQASARRPRRVIVSKRTPQLLRPKLLSSRPHFYFSTVSTNRELISEFNETEISHGRTSWQHAELATPLGQPARERFRSWLDRLVTPHASNVGRRMGRNEMACILTVKAPSQPGAHSSSKARSHKRRAIPWR